MNNKILYLQIVSFFLLSNLNLSAQSQNITILSIENSDRSVDLLYEKKNPGSYTLTLEFSNLSNCNVSTYEKVVSEDSGFIMKLEPLDKDQDITYSMRYSATLGIVNPKIDNLFRYVLPFKNGKKVKVFESESAGEKYFGLKKSVDWKSYAVASNKPDTVYSMRKGIVVMIDSSYNDNSLLDAQFTSRRNQVVIEHEDGTFAMYKGLKKDGIFVELGQTVNAQTELGIIEKYNKKGYRLDFDVFYLSQDVVNSKIEQSPLRAKDTYQYFPPVFYTQEGRKRLESGKEYTVFINENI
jgi:murein DD-endopeptidase MepM/ murein hydrolase activator NlpD